MDRGGWQATVHSGLRVGHDWSDLAQWEAALQHRGLGSVLCDDLEGWDGEVGGKETHIVDSSCCIAETNTML